MDHLEEQAIPGVVFIAGDFHFAQVCRVSPQGESGSSIFEVLVGPGGSFLNPMGGLIRETDQFIRSVSAWNYAEFVCDPDLKTLSVAFISDDGDVLDTYTISLV